MCSDEVPRSPTVGDRINNVYTVATRLAEERQAHARIKLENEPIIRARRLKAARGLTLEASYVI